MEMNEAFDITTWCTTCFELLTVRKDKMYVLFSSEKFDFEDETNGIISCPNHIKESFCSKKKYCSNCDTEVTSCGSEKCNYCFELNIKESNLIVHKPVCSEECRKIIMIKAMSK